MPVKPRNKLFHAMLEFVVSIIIIIFIIIIIIIIILGWGDQL